MDDWEIMQKCRMKWARERAATRLSPLDEKMAVAYHRGFMDALNVALGRVIAEGMAEEQSAAQERSKA
jgi:hypothetical protein